MKFMSDISGLKAGESVLRLELHPNYTHICLSSAICLQRPQELPILLQGCVRRMASPSPTLRSSTPTATTTTTVIPLKRPHGLEDEQHAPTISSPLNPDFASARSRKAPPAREQREKKESLKKREAKGGESARAHTPDTQNHGRKTKKAPDTFTNTQSLIRYTIPMPKPYDFNPPGAPILVTSMTRARRQFYESQEQ